MKKQIKRVISIGVLILAAVGLMGIAPESVRYTDHLIANVNNTFDLGETGRGWRNLYLGTGLVFKGTSYNATITQETPTATRTTTFPNRTGQVQIASAGSALTPGAAVALTVGLSNLYTLTPGDNQDSTITFSGAGTAGEEITILITTAGTADEVITFHATLVSSTGTLTVGTTAARYYTIRFISNGTHWYEVCRTGEQT